MAPGRRALDGLGQDGLREVVGWRLEERPGCRPGPVLVQGQLQSAEDPGASHWPSRAASCLGSRLAALLVSEVPIPHRSGPVSGRPTAQPGEEGSRQELGSSLKTHTCVSQWGLTKKGWACCWLGAWA